MSTPMKFVFKNLGPITEAELELGDLTIISGRNNTGKTYLVYTLYGFMKRFSQIISSGSVHRFFDNHFQKMVSLSTDDLVDKLNSEDSVEWQTDVDILVEEQGRLIQEMSQTFSEHEIYRVINAPRRLFEDASLDANLKIALQTNLHIALEIMGDKELSLRYDGKNITVNLTSSELEYGDEDEDDDEEEFITRQDIEKLYSHLLLRGIFESYFRPFIFSSARHSIPLFINELDYARSQWVRAKVQERISGESAKMPFGQNLVRDISNYALPIHDNIDFNRSISPRAERNDNKPQSDFPEDIEKMMGGFFTSKDGELHFTASDENSLDFEIPLHLASSSAWEMSNLYFFLCYFMDMGSGYFIIIDEPESHLDTANQIRLARLLAQLVNSGNRVLITTHSDYLVKEVNNLIMLSSSFARKEETITRLGYREVDILSPDQVRAYTAEGGTLNPNKVDEFGIQMPVFDQTIDDINRTARELFIRIKREKGDD